MTAILPVANQTEIFYPSADGEPVAETFDHLYALLTTLEVLKQYLANRQATVLADQFLYYSQGFPKLRVAPDVMVIFDVAPGGRDNYKLWEEGQVPRVIFEMTSAGTQDKDQVFKKTLYEQLGVKEYWLFDPKGEWIEEKLRGYRLRGEIYESITDSRSEPLQLRLQIEGRIIGFYREDNGEKLLIPDELAAALQQEVVARQQAEEQVEQERQRAEQAEAQVEQLKAKLRELGVEPNTKDN
ncbi:MAG: Uma2 family endonuclease [Richelia sp. RM2_1_2]|nr:Uma2 family endonuclease [Richelia sp. SM2_1_7]NJM19430.1 Uma2 family endonuclease [Richelia sp. SM1_7_0]NJN08658.1 Uma2 family endonuclease [Richelia sp. RM1_1_1]NJO27727.1 Uma2 family endonuclease [Richelia sp. SL_2_1]NJO59955.1 Uma2 family endonuclease [Richelia sp. RM2_1_2]